MLRSFTKVEEVFLLKFRSCYEVRSKFDLSKFYCRSLIEVLLSKFDRSSFEVIDDDQLLKIDTGTGVTVMHGTMVHVDRGDSAEHSPIGNLYLHK